MEKFCSKLWESYQKIRPSATAPRTPHHSAPRCRAPHPRPTPAPRCRAPHSRPVAALHTRVSLPRSTPAPRCRAPHSRLVAVGRDVPIAPPRHRRGARLCIPLLLVRTPLSHAHYPGGAMGTSRPTAITPANGILRHHSRPVAVRHTRAPLPCARHPRPRIARGGSPPRAARTWPPPPVGAPHPPGSRPIAVGDIVSRVA